MLKSTVVWSSDNSQECPSKLGHRVVGRIVTNVVGNRYCLHPDCTKANMDEVLSHHQNQPQRKYAFG